MYEHIIYLKHKQNTQEMQDTSRHMKEQPQAKYHLEKMYSLQEYNENFNRNYETNMKPCAGTLPVILI